jgi:hypothetical protein
VAYVRTVKTASGATAVQIVWSSRRGSRTIEHLGSARDDQELEAFKAAARQRLAAEQGGLVGITATSRQASESSGGSPNAAKLLASKRKTWLMCRPARVATNRPDARQA